MYPLYDPEGQLAAYEYYRKLTENRQSQGKSFIGVIAATFFASDVTPLALWLLVIGLTQSAS
jgi:hypothetical protein